MQYTYVILSFCLSLLLIPGLIKLCHQWQWLDVPTGRKQHIKAVPSIGGIAIFLACWIAGLASNLSFDFHLLLGWSGAALLITMIGAWDDLKDIRALYKLIGQIFIANLLFFSGFQLAIPYIFPFSSYLLTVGFIVALINAYNLIDGVDGLAGSLGLLACLAFGWLFLAEGLTNWSLWAFIMAAAIGGFLRYNFLNARIFMGDSGAMLIGMSIAVFSLVYLNTNTAATAPLYVYSIIMVPFIDMLRVFVQRLVNRRSPFSADRIHIHHLLLRAGLPSYWICAWTLFYTLLLVLLVPVFSLIPISINLLLMTGFSILLSVVVHWQVNHAAHTANSLIPSRKLVSEGEINSNA
ncbi:MAG: MraY family glycosyltransferase [Bacteroidota bacterium]